MPNTITDIGKGVEKKFLQVIEEIPEKLREIQGIYELSPFSLAEKYFANEEVADYSIDPNANVSSKSVVNFYSEIFKPQLKLRSYYELWKRIGDKYGLVDANEKLRALLDGSLYFHDITKLDIPYCFAFDASFLLFEGRPYGWLPGRPPKRSSSFIGQIVETTMDFSQQLAGAVGIPNLLVCLAYYTNKERSNLKRVIKKLTKTKELIENISVFLSGLGYDFNEQYQMGSVEKNVEAMLAEICKEENINASYFEIPLEFPSISVKLVEKVYNKYVEDLLQQFVHVMHNTFRIGGDSPFTNVSLFDKYVLRELFKDSFYPDGSKIVDNEEEIMKLQTIYANFFIKGSPITGKKYRFPISTLNIRKWTKEDCENGRCKFEDIGKISDEEFFKQFAVKNLKRGTFNWHVGEKVATCCRLTSDLSELKDEVRSDTFGNGGISIGSHRVVAINLHRVALKSKENNTLFEVELEKHLDMAKKCLLVHKELLKERIDSGILPFFRIGWCNLNQFFSTFGYIGLWDSWKVIENNNNDLDSYKDFATHVLDFMDNYAKKAGKENKGYAFNVEEIPGENASPKLAAMDNFFYQKYDWYKPVDLLSNQMIPLYEEVDFFDRLRITGKLMNKVSGGAILHLNLLDDLTEGSNEKLHRMLIEYYGIIHYAINRGSTTCIKGHTTIGIHDECPVCGDEIDTHTLRVVGFESDVKNWSKERRKEFKNRQFYSNKNILRV